jgi:hypothetical protein
MPAKRGRLSNEERQFVLANAGSLTPEQIAAKLSRAVDGIAEYIRLHYVAPKVATAAPKEQERSDRIVIRQELRQTESWKRLKNEFILEELRYFEESYVKLMSQFKGDVLASEETQIFQVIKFEILMSRNLVARQKALTDIQRLEKTQEDFLSKFEGNAMLMEETDRDYVLGLETQLQSAKAAEQSRTTEYVKLQERHDAIMKNLKATRDQRVKQIESSKVNWLGVIKALQDKEIQDREGRQIEMVRIAADSEYLRLGRPHAYEDGNEDSPILSSDTVDLGPEEDEHE